jgi:DNA modification methylase
VESGIGDAIYKDICACGAKRIDKQYGLEKTPELFIENMVNVFREVRRVLKKEGTCWINIGDSYVSGKGRYSSCKQTISGKSRNEPTNHNRPDLIKHKFLKDKDIVGIPWRLAFALQSDGWYLRQDIIWSKPNPMPESVSDRCTKSHEYIFLLTKSPKYYYDNVAIFEKALLDGRKDTIYKEGLKYKEIELTSNAKSLSRNRERYPQRKMSNTGFGGDGTGLHTEHDYNSNNGIPGRNKRSVWNVSTQPFSEAHFATFPLKLIEPMILAGTSEKGYCVECGKPIIREVKASGGTIGSDWANREISKVGVFRTQGIINKQMKDGTYKRETIGWCPFCKCNADFVPGIILDPFIGAGTVAIGALKHNRNFIGIELSPEYIEIALKRIKPYLNEIKMF